MKKLIALYLLIGALCCGCVTPGKQEPSNDIYLKKNPFNLDRVEGYDSETGKCLFEVRRNPFNLNRYEIREVK